MKYKSTTPLVDAGSERALLGAILAGGESSLLDVVDIVKVQDFFFPVNQALFSVLRHMVLSLGMKVFEMPAVMATVSTLGITEFEDTRKREYLYALAPVKLMTDSLINMAATICKLAIARRAKACLSGIVTGLDSVTGSETITELLASIEDPVYAFAADLSSQTETDVAVIGADVDEQLTVLESHPKDVVGLPSGFPAWDTAIGGGLRPGGVHVIGARPKQGKSFLCLNIAFLVASAKIPVLYLDTELTRRDQRPRLLALMSGVPINRIETGKYTQDQDEFDKVHAAAEVCKSLPLTHAQVAGMSVQAMISIIRRWLLRSVGMGENGICNQALVIYDYLKLMDKRDISSNMAEFQALGFLMTELSNFAIKHGVPMVCTCQLNRDGVEKEGSEVFAGSDRILWLATSASILKRKSPDECEEDPIVNGSRKLIVTDTRFGSGMDSGDYINIRAELDHGWMRSGKTRSQVLSSTVPVLGQVQVPS